MNTLLKNKSVIVCTIGRSEGATLVYKEANAEETNKMKGLSENDLLVLQLISESNNLGIWSKDLRVRSNLQQNTMAKALKNLENRELIKAVKSVNTRNKKVYMLKDLEPSKEITGGAWYTEQEFDAEFITVLYETVRGAMVRSHGCLLPHVVALAAPSARLLALTPSIASASAHTCSASGTYQTRATA